MAKNKRIGFLVTTTVLLAALIWICGEALAGKFTRVTLEQKELLEVKVYRLSVDFTSKQPVVFLADSFEERALPIWIGRFEANAIYSEMQGIKHRRPHTHDLLERIIQKAYGKIHRIVIPYAREGIYYAIIVMGREGAIVEIDARPSDSIVMALKFKVPIFVSKALFSDLAVSLGEQAGVEERYGLTVQELSPSLALCFSFESTQGALVSDVRIGSRAEQDGIERGDIFVQVGGQSVEDTGSLRDALAGSEGPVEARVFRDAHYLSLTLHPK